MKYPIKSKPINFFLEGVIFDDFYWYTFILALGLAFVEGLEASLLAATRSPKAGWGRTIMASLGGIGSAGVIGAIVFYLYYVIPAFTSTTP